MKKLLLKFLCGLMLIASCYASDPYTDLATDLTASGFSVVGYDSQTGKPDIYNKNNLFVQLTFNQYVSVYANVDMTRNMLVIMEPINIDYVFYCLEIFKHWREIPVESAPYPWTGN